MSPGASVCLNSLLCAWIHRNGEIAELSLYVTVSSLKHLIICTSALLAACVKAKPGPPEEQKALSTAGPPSSPKLHTVFDGGQNGTAVFFLDAFFGVCGVGGVGRVSH